jgi:hypothetical protein
MNTSKVAGFGLAVIASLAFTAGCQTSKSGGSSTPSPTPAADPVQVLGASVKDLSSTSYKYVAKSGDATGSGAVDPVAKTVRTDVSATAEGMKFQVELVALAKDYYLKLTGLPIPGLDSSKWIHLDANKLTSLKGIGIDDVTDPTGLKGFDKAIVSAEKTGDRTYKGTLDLTKLTAGPFVDAEAATKNADKVKAVPFEATLDEKGRMAKLSFTVPALGSDPAAPTEVTYSDYGAPVDATKPAAESVIEAPELVYKILTG